MHHGVGSVSRVVLGVHRDVDPELTNDNKHIYGPREAAWAVITVILLLTETPAGEVASITLFAGLPSIRNHFAKLNRSG